MNALVAARQLFNRTLAFDFLAPLALRLYLAPVFWMAGTSKLGDNWLPNENTVAWFGNPDWGLGLPMPWVMTALAAYTEVLGALALLFGALLRLIAIPLMVTMLVAIFAVHWEHGWQAVADPSFCLFNCADAQDAAERLAKGKALLKTHGNYEWLTGQGGFVILNNGIEFAATYFIMLLTLFFTGAGRWLSVDYWLARPLDARTATRSPGA